MTGVHGASNRNSEGPAMVILFIEVYKHSFDTTVMTGTLVYRESWCRIRCLLFL